MITEQEMRSILFEALENLFEFDLSKIDDDTNLYEDLDIDSIDAIDLLDHIKRKTGYKLNADDFRSVRTVRDIIKAVKKQAETQENNS